MKKGVFHTFNAGPPAEGDRHRKILKDLPQKPREKYQVLGQGDTSMCFAISPEEVLVIAGIGEKEESLRKAIDVLQKLGRLNYVEENVKENKLYIFQKRIPGLPFLDKFIEEHVDLNNPQYKLNIALSIVYKLKELHQIGLMHGDLHVGNIMVDKEEAYLIDFDLSEDISKNAFVKIPIAKNKKDQKYNGVHHAPELAEGIATLKSDIYSLGSLFHEGTGGFLGLNLDKLPADKLKASGLDKKLKSMLSPNHKDRPELLEIERALLAMEIQMKLRPGSHRL